MGTARADGDSPASLCGGRAVGVAVALALLAACSDKITVSSEAEGPDAAASFSGFADMPMPSGALMDLSRTLIFGKDDRWTGRLALETDQSPDALYEFYQREMPKYQWREITALRAETSVITMARDDRIATVMIESAGLSGSAVTITVGPRSPLEEPQ